MSNDTMIREVDEELRRDQMRRLWRNVGPYVIGGAVAVVLLVAGYEGWNWWQSTNAAKSSDQFYAAMTLADGADIAAAQKALDGVIADTSGGYPMLAEFRAAALLAADGKTDEAVAAYDSLATAQTNVHLRGLALVLAANLLIDGGDVAAVRQRVGTLDTPDAPLRNAAREIIGLTEVKAGDLDGAIVTFQTIMDDPLSDRNLRSRVALYIAQLIAEGGKQAPAPAPEAATPAPDANAAPAASDTAPSAAVDASTELDVTPPAETPPSAPAN